MVQRIPAIVAAVCLSVYWFWVVVKLIQLGRKLGKDPNALPRERVGQLMRVVWYPCIAALLVGLWGTAFTRPVSFWALSMNAGPPNFFQKHRQPFLWLLEPGTPELMAGIVACGICMGCTIFTFVCWHRMGRSWRIGIDPGEKLAIVSTGPYRFVRHPIYALRMVINICACIAAPTPLVIAAAGVDFLLLQVEARREERYMESKHGSEYAKYKNSVGRFIPRAIMV